MGLPRTARPPLPPVQLEEVFLYDDPEAYGLDLGALAAYLAGVLPAVAFVPRTDFFSHHLGRFEPAEREALAEQMLQQLERAKLSEPAAEAPPDEADAAPSAPSPWGDLYHGPRLQALLYLLIPPPEQRLGRLHVVFTGLRLAVERPEATPRQVLGLLGEPNLISLSGLFEALERPREYDFLRVQVVLLGLEQELEDLEQRFAPQMLTESDPRLGETLHGLVLQALAYRLWGEAFCADPACRLYDAASHERLLRAQTGPGAGLCEQHTEWLRAAGGAPERA